MPPRKALEAPSAEERFRLAGPLKSEAAARDDSPDNLATEVGAAAVGAAAEGPGSVVAGDRPAGGVRASDVALIPAEACVPRGRRTAWWDVIGDSCVGLLCRRREHGSPRRSRTQFIASAVSQFGVIGTRYRRGGPRTRPPVRQRRCDPSGTRLLRVDQRRRMAVTCVLCGRRACWSHLRSHSLTSVAVHRRSHPRLPRGMDGRECW